MKVRIKLVVLISKNGLWRVYATQWVGLWRRAISYARQLISYHMHAKHVRIIYAKVCFCVSIIPQVFVFICRTIYTHFHETGLLFIYLLHYTFLHWWIYPQCVKSHLNPKKALKGLKLKQKYVKCCMHCKMEFLCYFCLVYIYINIIQ